MSKQSRDKTGMIGKVLDYQARQVTYNIYTFFKKRKHDPKTAEYRDDINLINTVSEATGLSKSTVTRVIREGNNMKIEIGTVEFKPQEKKKHIRKKRIEIDEFTEAVIRRKVIQFYSVKNEVPSVRRLNALLREEKILNCSNEYLRQLLHKLGFTNTENDTTGLMRERDDIVSERIEYLRAMKEFRKLEKPIFYFNDTKYWNQDDVVISKPADMPQLVVVHAAGEVGFLDGARLMMKMKPKSAQNSSSEDVDSFKWVKDKMLGNIPPFSVIVMNAPILPNSEAPHDKPNLASTRGDLQDWLKRHNIPFKETAPKNVLIEAIKAHESKAEHDIGALLVERGQKVLYLPQNHSDLNPAATVWEELKDSLDGVSPKTLITKYPEEKWKLCFKQVLQVEMEYYGHDLKMGDKQHVDQLRKVKEEPEEEEDTKSENNSSMDCDY